MELTPNQERAIELLSPIKYHQSYTLPRTETRGTLKVTYAIIRPPLGEDAPTILFCMRMGFTRYSKDDRQLSYAPTGWFLTG